MSRQPKILVCPLDWGIGHATRCVPVIQEFLHQGAEVTLGASGRSRAFLEKEFPDLPMVDFPGVDITYPEKGNRMPLHMLLRSPALLKGIREEHRMLQEFVQKYSFDGVVSDNRYGLYSSEIPSVLVTHQVFIRMPGPLKLLEPVLEKQTKTFIRRFDFCWIPDNDGETNLSGDLSHKKPVPANCRYVGPLSRFSGMVNEPDPSREGHDVLFLLSGPEPQRSLLEQKIKEELRNTDINAAMVLGKPEAGELSGYPGHIDVFPHLETPALYRLMKQSRLVIARPGYSTIMDLAATGNRAVLIPTPGQTEQEYIGRRFEEMGIFHCVQQKDFKLQEALAVAGNYHGLQQRFSANLLEKSVKEFLALVFLKQ